MLICSRSFPLRAALAIFSLPLLAQSNFSPRATTFAGTGVRSGAAAGDAGVRSVGQMTPDPSGNLVFADPTNNVLWRLHSDNTLEIVAGTGEQGFAPDGVSAVSARLIAPNFPAYDRAGNLYFVDTFNYRIRRVDTRGIMTTVAGNGVPFINGMDLEGLAASRSISISSSSGFAVDRDGNVYFTETGFNRIRRVDPQGQMRVFAGKINSSCSDCSDGNGGAATLANLHSPGQLAVDSKGNLYFVDGGSFLRRISPDGIIQAVAGYGVLRGTPAPGQSAVSEAVNMFLGVAIDQSDNVYFTARWYSSPMTGGAPPPQLMRISTDGVIHAVASFELPVITGASSGAFYISGMKIQQINETGDISVRVDLTQKTSPDGTLAAKAQIAANGFLTVNHAGEVYFTENETCRIRKVDSGGVIRTVAGTGVCGPALPALPGISTMAFDSQNRLWARGVGRTFIIAADGTVTEPTLPRIGVEPTITVDGKDRLYVLGVSYLNRLNSDGSVGKIIEPDSSGRLPAGIPSPEAIGVDPQGNAYFFGNRALYRITDDGTYAKIRDYPVNTYIGSPAPKVLAVDANGTLWSGVTFANASGLFQLGRNIFGYSGEGSDGPQQYYVNGSSAFGPDGSLYVAGGNRIIKVTGLAPQTPPTISSGGVVNAASFAGGPIAPGELVSIFGTGFFGPGFVSPGGNSTTIAGSLPLNNQYSELLLSTKVTFDGYAGHIISMTDTQINVFVPTVGRSSLIPVSSVVVQVGATTSVPAPAPWANTAVNLFTAAQGGSGQGAILNQDQSINSESNPARLGTIISLFGTGEGLLTTQVPDGYLVLSTPYPHPNAAVTVTIGGRAAELIYYGSAPTLPVGVFQINARIPPDIAAGNAVIQLATPDSASTRTVTVAVQ